MRGRESDAVWTAIGILTFSIFALLKVLVLGGDWVVKKAKAVRFRVLDVHRRMKLWRINPRKIGASRPDDNAETWLFSGVSRVSGRLSAALSPVDFRVRVTLRESGPRPPRPRQETRVSHDYLLDMRPEIAVIGSICAVMAQNRLQWAINNK